MEKTTSTLASSNGSVTPSKIRSSTSARVSYSESPTSTPIQLHARIGGAEGVDRVAAAAAEVDDGRAGARGEQGRDEVLRERLHRGARRERRSQQGAEIGTRQAAIGHRALNTTSVRSFYESFWADAPRDPEP